MPRRSVSGASYLTGRFRHRRVPIGEIDSCIACYGPIKLLRLMDWERRESAMDAIPDKLIEDLLLLPKRVTNVKAKWLEKPGHRQRNFNLLAVGHGFRLFQRQNARVPDDFSCGLVWDVPGGGGLILARYNGPSHVHGNKLEGDTLRHVCHIHKATERYLSLGVTAEGFAEASQRYCTVEGALHCLVTDCFISGLDTTPDEPDLFKP